MAKRIDFDAYREEKKDDVITVHMYDEDIKIPAQPSLDLMEQVLSFINSKDKGNALADEEVVFMIEKLIGKEQYKKLKENGASVNDAEWLIKQITKMYTNTDEEDDTKNLTPSTSQKSGDQ